MIALNDIKKNLKKKAKELQAALRRFRSQHPAIYICAVILIAAVIAFIFEKVLRVYSNRILKTTLTFNIKRLILVGAIIETVCLVFAYGKKGINFLYRWRYLFGAGLFILCVALKINYSSSGALDASIQPNHVTETDDILIGTNRNIRSDEYIVSTPMVLSQSYNDFSLVNPDIMADNVVVAFYPKLPNKMILSLLTSPQYLGFVFLPLENAYSFYQLLPWFIAFFAVFEMLIIITKKRKLMSLVSTLFLVFSPVILWFDSVQYMMYIALLFDIFYMYIHYGKSWKSKLGFSALFGWVASCFVMMVYPAWQVPYGYVLLALLIYLAIDNRKLLKWHDLLYALPVIAIVITFVLPTVLISLEQYKLTTQTVYPGARSENGGGGMSAIFYYISSIFFPLIDVGNPCEASGFISLFPIPILLGIYVAIKKFKEKQCDVLLNALVILSLFLSFMCLVGNGFIAKVTLLSLTPMNRLRPVLEFVCVLIIIRLLAVHQTKKIVKTPALLALITAGVTAILVYIGASRINEYVNGAYMHTAMVCAAFTVYYILLYCLLDRRQQTLYIVGIVTALFSGYQFLSIHPLRSGLEIYTDKPVAQKIRELSADNQEALWITTGSMTSDYALANDARVVNSVNYYPIINRWKLLDSDGKNSDIYNRYAHIGFDISDKKETSFELVAPDAFTVTLNYKDVCLLNPTYFLSNKNYNSIPDWSQKLIYNEDGMYIYRLDCQSE